MDVFDLSRPFLNLSYVTVGGAAGSEPHSRAERPTTPTAAVPVELAGRKHLVRMFVDPSPEEYVMHGIRGAVISVDPAGGDPRSGDLKNVLEKLRALGVLPAATHLAQGSRELPTEILRQFEAAGFDPPPLVRGEIPSGGSWEEALRAAPGFTPGSLLESLRESSLPGTLLGALVPGVTAPEAPFLMRVTRAVSSRHGLAVAGLHLGGRIEEGEKIELVDATGRIDRAVIRPLEDEALRAAGLDLLLERAPGGPLQGILGGGVTISRPGTMRPGLRYLTDVYVHDTPLGVGARRSIPLSSGAAVSGLLHPLAGRPLEPGTRGTATLTLDSPVMAGTGSPMSFYLRGRPALTGRVLEPLPPSGRPAKKARIVVPTPMGGRMVDGSQPPPRRVRLGLSSKAPAPEIADEEVLVVDQPLEAGGVYYLRIDVSAEKGGTNVVEPEDIPACVLDRIPEGAPLDVAVWSTTAELDEKGPYRAHQQLRLLPEAASTFVYVRLEVPPSIDMVEIETCVSFRNTVLQWLRTRARVVGGPGGAEAVARTAELGNRSEVLYTISAALGDFEAFESPAVSLLVDDDRLRVAGLDAPSPPLEIGPGLRASLTAFQQQLDLIAYDGEYDDGTRRYRFRDANKGRREELGGFLLSLADLGRAVFSAAFPSWKVRQGLRERLARPELIEVAETAASPAVPWGLVYDQPLAEEGDAKAEGLERTVCMRWVDAEHQVALGEDENGQLRQLDFAACSKAADCPLPAAAGHTVCVYGFWGFKHRLQQPPGARLRADDPTCPPVPRYTAVDERPEVRILGHPKIAFAGEHAKEVAALAKGPWKPLIHYADTRAEIKKSLRSPAAHVVYFYCHGGVDPKSKLPHLLVGEDVAVSAVTLDTWNVRWVGARPLIFVNGCETVAYKPEAMTTLAVQFRGAEAAGVVGTEIEVVPLLASWFGREFLRRFLGGEDVGGALLLLRRELLQRFNPLGLAYTNHAMAGLRLLAAEDLPLELERVRAEAAGS